MTVYRLLWVLLRHALTGRFRDEVFVSVELTTPDRSLGVAGAIVGLDVQPRREGFVVIDAVSEDPGPWCEEPPFLDVGLPRGRS